MIDLTISQGCDRIICMSIDIGSIIIGLAIGVSLVTLIFWKRLFNKNKK